MELFAKMDVRAIQNGLIGKVGGVKHFAVLAAIASYADSKGEAYPSQEKIGELIGYSRKSVNQYVNDLRKITIDGEPILVVKQEKSAQGRRNKYVLSSKSGFQFGSGVVTNSPNVVTEQRTGVVTAGLQEGRTISNKSHTEQEQDIVFDNARHVLDYFRQKYYDKYNVTYSPNWGRDSYMIKNKLMANFSDSEIKTIIDVVIEEYSTRWAKPSFPRPTIGQLCTWLPNEALPIAAKRKHEAQRIEQESERYDMDDEQLDRMLNEI